MAEVFISKAAEFKDGDRKIAKTSKGEVGVFFEGGTFYAYSNVCPHQGGPACEGVMMNKVVDIIAEDRTYQGQTFSDDRHFVCPWHGYEFDLKTGHCWGDRKVKLKKFEVVRKGDDVFVKV